MKKRKSNPDIWTASVASDRKLIGPYPPKIDLCGGRFPDLDMGADSRLTIEGDGNVRQIKIPCDVVGVDYLVIRNLPALESLTLEAGRRSNIGVQWLDLRGVPSLSKVRIKGPIRSLKISGANALAALDLSGCPDLDFVAFNDVSQNVEINVCGCLKLRGIEGVVFEGLEASRVCEQIDENQKRSRRDRQIYKSMTYTDIDFVYEVINEGLKALSRSDALGEFHESLLGYYDLHACDPQFRPYLYRILEPLESVYTGGTGETYAYEVSEKTFDVKSFEISEENGTGVSSLEDCLSHMLELTRMSLMSRHRRFKNMSDKRLMELLNDAVNAIPKNMIPGLPIMVSESIVVDQREEISHLIRSLGMKMGGGDEELYAYIHPIGRVPKKDQWISRRAVLSIDSAGALDQLNRYKSWIA